MLKVVPKNAVSVKVGIMNPYQQVADVTRNAHLASGLPAAKLHALIATKVDSSLMKPKQQNLIAKNAPLAHTNSNMVQQIV